MTIINHEKLANHISDWIRDYTKKAGIKTLVLGLSGGIDSALAALLCKKTNMPLLCVNMPCHSSDSAYGRAKAFADEYGLYLNKIDLSSVHEVVYNQAKIAKFNGPIFDTERKLAVGGLRSCLRTPILSFYANSTKGIIVGTTNRSESNITRYFQKYGDGCADINPIVDLFKSEVYELFAYLADNMLASNPAKNVSEMHLQKREINSQIRMLPPEACAIYDVKPTADLWGPDSGQEDEKELGITYDEIEWADREDIRTTEDIGKVYTSIPRSGIVKREADPAKHPAWLGYTGRQREVIAKLHQMEKISRHKHNPAIPVCHIRDKKDLVR